MSAVSSLPLLFLTLFLHSHFPATGVATPDRAALEIIIGGESPSSPAPDYGDCPPPPPPPDPICPPSPNFHYPTPPSPPPPPPQRSPPPPPPKPSPHPPPKPSHPPPPRIPSPPPSPPSGGFENERIKKAYKVIQKLKSKIKCDPFRITKTWQGNDVCNYKGFRCAIRPDINTKAVAAADFNGYGFGSDGKNDLQLLGFLDELDDLTLFHANSNNFTGQIPPNLGSKIKYFYEIDLSNNKFDGRFPNEILDATNASFIDLRYNNFSGRVPGQIFERDLDVLFLNNNGFTGRLPENVGDTPALYLTFANNRFSGPIPKSIGRCQSLREVLFLNNRFSGCLPTEIGNLTNARIFDAGDNKLTGPIPHSFACLSEINDLNLARNQLYGAIPESVCQLPKLANLSLCSNYFTQVGPACRDLIKKKVLDVRHNCILDLPGQRSAAECEKFFSAKHACPNEKMLMSYVPCKKGSGGNGGDSHQQLTTAGAEAADRELAPAPAPSSSFTYHALRPHMLR